MVLPPPITPLVPTSWTTSYLAGRVDRWCYLHFTTTGIQRARRPPAQICISLPLPGTTLTPPTSCGRRAPETYSGEDTDNVRDAITFRRGVSEKIEDHTRYPFETNRRTGTGTTTRGGKTRVNTNRLYRHIRAFQLISHRFHISKTPFPTSVRPPTTILFSSTTRALTFLMFSVSFCQSLSNSILPSMGS